MTRKRQRGSATIEMALVGIPIIFTLISIFEMSRGMWIYHTLAYSVKAGVRLASVHGQNCINNPPGVTNNCPKSISDIAKVIKDAAVGLDPATTLLTFRSATSPAVPCYMGSSSSSNVTTTLGTGVGCLSLTTAWPPNATSENQVGKLIRIDIRTRFRSAIAMVFPGAHTVSFAEADLGATSQDYVQF
ncbi:MAG TPA: TadE family protein [Bryobacteraceae bacterium]|jgi:Flp pilus assembly protein TadG|nr:TadE family protein [Bryobacteraceae bacterium]